MHAPLVEHISTRRRYDHSDERARNELPGALQDSDSGQIRIGDGRRRRRRRRLREGLSDSGGGDGDCGEGSSPPFPPQVRAPRARGGIDRPSVTNSRRGRAHHPQSAFFADRRKDLWISAKPAILSSPRGHRGALTSGGEQTSGPCAEVPPIPEEEEEDFPVLSLASGSETRPKPLLPQKPPEELLVTKTDALNYAHVAGKLSVNAASTAPETDGVNSSGQRSGTVDECFRRLIVLRGFRDDRRSGTTRDLDGDKSSELEGKGLHSASSLQPSGTKGVLLDNMVKITAPYLPQPPAPVPQPTTLATGSFMSRRSGATAAIAALRSRLRERWFRLEAMRKAERQRVVEERSLMAVEDRESMDREVAHGRRTRESDAIGPRHRVIDLVDEPEDNDSANSQKDIERGDVRSRGDDDTVGTVDFPCAASGAPSAFPLRLDDTVGENIEASSIGTVAESKDSERNISAFWDTKPLSAAGAAAVRRAEATIFTAASIGAADASAISPSRPLKLADSVGENGQNAGKGRVPSGLYAPPYDEDIGNSDVDFLLGGSGRGGSRELFSRDRKHAACESDMAWVLNDLLVRSGGTSRTADGKDKV